MDPVSIIGVAAASFQFAEVAVRSISKIAKITQNLEDVPRRMKDHLNDTQTSIARLRDLSAELRRDPSVSSLESSRLGRLTTAVDKWINVAAGLESRLHGVISPSNSPKYQKWKDLRLACRSLRQAEDIEWQVERLKRLSDDIWEELLRTILASQLEIKSCLFDGEARISSNLRGVFHQIEAAQVDSKAQLLATIQEEGAETRRTLDNSALSTSSDICNRAVELQDAQSNCKDELSAVILEEGNKNREALGSHTESLNSSFNNLKREYSLQARQHRDIAVGKVNAHISQELRAFRSFLLSATHGDHAFLDTGLETSATTSVVHGESLLTASHNTLGSPLTHNNPTAPDPFIPANQRSRSFTQVPPPCCCPLRVKKVWQVSKGLRLRYEAVKHVFPCSQSIDTQNFRSASIRIELPPFMGPAIDVSVATATTRTGYSFTQSLRYFPTVQRLNSPIFREFDALHTSLEQYTRSQAFDPDHIGSIRCMIQALPRKLQAIAAGGTGSCRDKDEVGNTILLVCVIIQSIFHQLLRLNHRSPYI